MDLYNNPDWVPDTRLFGEANYTAPIDTSLQELDATGKVKNPNGVLKFDDPMDLKDAWNVLSRCLTELEYILTNSTGAGDIKSDEKVNSNPNPKPSSQPTPDMSPLTTRYGFGRRFNTYSIQSPNPKRNSHGRSATGRSFAIMLISY